jgi:predicted porin
VSGVGLYLFFNIHMEHELKKTFSNGVRTPFQGIALAGMAFGLALSAGAAAAQNIGSTNVQFTGLVGVYVDRLQRSDMKVPITQIGHGGLTTSYWGFRGREDLGRGYSAIFVLESFFQPDTGGMGRNATDPLFSRNAYVGFASSKGTLTFGRQTNPTYAAMGLLSPFGSSVVFSPLVLQTFVGPYGGAIIGDTVWNNAIQYQSPVLGGVTATVIHALGEQPGNSSINNTGLHLRYVGGPFSAAFSAQRNRTAAIAPSTGQTAYLAGIAYDFRFLKVFASAAKTDAEITNIVARTYDAGLSIPVASGAVWLEFAKTRRSNPAVAETTRKTASLAYDYPLSKRTDVYAVYSRDALTNNPAGNTYGVGLRHTF